MKVLVATAKAQFRDGDYCWTVEGEPVRVSEPCDRDLLARDEPGNGGCGCSRGFSGLSSMASTTTALVVDSPLTRADLSLALRAGLQQAGYISDPPEPDELEDVEAELSELLEIADTHEVGTILERDFDELSVRCVLE